ncbi:MAG: dTMP kinase [Actinomycetota bacterium]|nr:dTMP kinase [Actinomycetota bacterium]
MRFFAAQFVSSLGDWIGVIAIAVFAQGLAGNAGVGLVMTARVLPGFLVGPIAGVFADRYDRKKLMVGADIIRAFLIFSVPFFESLVYLLVVSALLESLTLVWGPAKDASLPHFVKRHELQHASSLSLIGVYGPWPLASLLFASLIPLADLVGTNVSVLAGLADNNQEALALWLDAFTFAFSGLMIATLAIPSSTLRDSKFDFKAAKRDLVEGLSFVAKHRQVRPWLLGIGCTFTAAGGVFSLGPGFVGEILRGGKSGFGFLIGFLGTGMIVGLLASGVLTKRVQKDVLFSSCLMLLGGSLIALSSMGSLDTAIPVASALGFFAGAAYSTAYSLMQENTSDALRGRTFSAAYTIIRMGTLIGLALFPFLASAFGSFADGADVAGYPISGTRITLWVAGGIVIGGGVLSMRAIKAGRAERSQQPPRSGFFIVFEGGEGAGKSTQLDAFVQWLEARGDDVVTTREPGGTTIGAHIRKVLLDPACKDMDPHTEALLYAADRAQHVAEVIKPALREGKIVVSDRFIDSSLAYQGLARGLGLEDVYEISKWAVDDTLPDVVLFLKLDPQTGLRRKTTEPDRIELEEDGFHEKVSRAYAELAVKFPERFVVLDAAKPPADVHKAVVAVFEERVATRTGGGRFEAAESRSKR